MSVHGTYQIVSRKKIGINEWHQRIAIVCDILERKEIKMPNTDKCRLNYSSKQQSNTIKKKTKKHF